MASEVVTETQTEVLTRDLMSVKKRGNDLRDSMDLRDAMDLIKKTEYVSLSKTELLDNERVFYCSNTIVRKTVRLTLTERKRFDQELIFNLLTKFGSFSLSSLHGARPPVRIRERSWRVWKTGRSQGLSVRLAVVSLHSRNNHQVYTWYALNYLIKSVVYVGVWDLAENRSFSWQMSHQVHEAKRSAGSFLFIEHRTEKHHVFGWGLCLVQPLLPDDRTGIRFSSNTHASTSYLPRRYYVPLTTFFCFYLPAVLPHYMFGETYWNAFFVSTMLRYVFSLNFTWLVNSAAHLWGCRPYDKHISPAENRFVSWAAIGEGFHNYHHTFPWDYSTSELGWKLNFTTMFIDCMAAIGLAYDLKTVPKEVIEKRKARTGDGSYDHLHLH
ncbi:unnamed protein product [Ixodes persulcatus]